jgi:lantibiotic biosynthesis protein
LIIVRIAGLSASILAPFSSDFCVRELENIQELLSELGKARSALANRLHESVARSPASLRRVLLAVRRDCFNGRPISPCRNLPFWSELDENSDGLAATVATLEERLADTRNRLESTYFGERDRERRHLLDLVEDRGLLRGIALASPDSVDNLHRLQPTHGACYGRKELRLEATLLRYVTRAAFKLSPYSTLTRIGLARVVDATASGSISLNGDRWEERSLLRMKRYLLEQLWTLLRRHPPFREDLQVQLNDTIEEIEPRRYRFLRPGYWDFDRQKNRFVYHVASLVKVNLDGPIVGWVLRELPAQRMTFGELCRIADEQAAASVPAGGSQLIERLERIGVLCLLPPWPAQAAELEKDILATLLAHPFDPELRPLIGVLDRLVDLIGSFSGAATPSRSVREIETLIDELWNVSASLGGLTAETPRSRLRTGNLYEDVFLRSTTCEIARISRRSVEKIQSSLPPLERFLSLYNNAHDLQLTIAAFAAQHWPGRSMLGVVELFAAAQPLWQSFMSFIHRLQQSRDRTGTFNPLNLASLKKLSRLREEAWQEFPQCLESSAEGWHLRHEVLADIVRGLPESLAPTVGLCLFLQPADHEGRRWVVNRIYEGTGRYGSRFTAVMSEEARSAYTEHLMARGWDRTGAELVDITCTQGDTLNVHALQTPRRLEIPTEPVYLPADRRLRLHDLSVRLHGSSLRPELVDAFGRPCRPVYLGGADSVFLPTPLRFLAALFGPGETHLLLPPRPLRQQGDLAVADRLTLDQLLVLARKRWLVGSNPLRGLAVSHGTEVEAFEQINHWRREHEIPDRVVFIEHVHHEIRRDLYKPQYLDFTSPLLVSLLRTALRQNPESLTFEEMLPQPDIAPKDEQNRPWAVEFQLDTLALRPSVPLHAGPVEAPLRNCASGIVQQEPFEARQQGGNIS